MAKRFGVLMKLVPAVFALEWKMQKKSIFAKLPKYRFAPCSYSNWQLNEESYKIAVKAVSADRSQRYKTFEEFSEDWKRRK